MPAPVGATVTITYDAAPDVEFRPLLDYLRTPAGRLYRVLAARKMNSKHPHRWRLELLVVDQIPGDADPTGYVHPLVFYPRGR